MKFSPLSLLKWSLRKKSATLFHERSIVHTLVSSVTLVCLLSRIIRYQIWMKIPHPCLFNGKLTMNPLRSNFQCVSWRCLEASSIKHHWIVLAKVNTLKFYISKEFRFLQNFQLLSEYIINPITSVRYRLHFEKCNHTFSQSKGLLLSGMIFSISLDIDPIHQESPYLYCSNSFGEYV